MAYNYITYTLKSSIVCARVPSTKENNNLKLMFILMSKSQNYNLSSLFVMQKFLDL